MKVFLSGLLGFLFSRYFTHSTFIAIPFGLLALGIPILFGRAREERVRIAKQHLWPEIIDHLVSGISAGSSLAESLAMLEFRGPSLAHEYFAQFARVIASEGEFGIALEAIRQGFSDPLADQVLEVLNYARLAGSRDTVLTLRTLGDFVRRDLALREEIRAKHGWVKNSAYLAAVAPWLILLIISTQPRTLQAFVSPIGATILLFSLLATVGAFVWMDSLAKLPSTPRIYRSFLERTS